MSKTIEIIRGTTNTFDIALKDEAGEFYTLKAGEVLRFGVKVRANLTEYKLTKELTAENINEAGDAYVLTLRPEDTADMAFMRYCYDVGLQSGADYFNVIPCSDFVVHHNITCREV